MPLSNKLSLQCRVCESGSIEKRFSHKGSLFYRCAHCGLIFIDPVPSPLSIQKHYSENYFKTWNPDGAGQANVRSAKLQTFQQWLEIIEGYTPAGTVLDIGCAMGFFLEIAQMRGWQAYGVEVSDYAASLAREQFADRIITGTLSAARFSHEFFDAITMFDVIEHISSPKEFLREVFRLAKVGAIIALTTADTASLSHALMGKHWPHFKPEHLNYFSGANLALALTQAGFRVLEIQRVKKFLSFNYIRSYFSTYRTPVLSELIPVACRLMPRYLSSLPVKFSTGEMLVIARKTSHA